MDQVRQVRFKSNRVRILSVSGDRRTLYLHDCFRYATPEVVDAVAAFLRSARGTAAHRGSVARLRDFAAARITQPVRPSRPPRPGPCCGTPAQRQFLSGLYAELNRTHFEGGLPDSLTLRFSDRMRRRLGHVRYHETPTGERGIVELALNIDLMLEGAEAQLVDTLLHEMAHVEAWLVHGHRGHGAVWKRIALRVGCEPRACTKATVQRRPKGARATTRVPDLAAYR